MIGFKIDQAKGLFFDRQKVTGKVRRTTRRVLSRFGAFVRRRAKSSIRKRKKSSPPGRPPSSHTGLLKRFLFFVWESIRQSVVVGPALLNKPDPNVLSLLEHGGSATRRFVILQNSASVAGRKRDRRGRFVKGSGKRTIAYSRSAKPRRVVYRARPFMGPALEKEKPNLPRLWADSVK